MKLGDLIPGLRDYGLPCWRKTKHASQGAAEAALRSLAKREKLKDATTANTFLCQYCGHWHVGHSSLKKESAK